MSSMSASSTAPARRSLSLRPASRLRGRSGGVALAPLTITRWPSRVITHAVVAWTYSTSRDVTSAVDIRAARVPCDPDFQVRFAE
jgi:hypothetical protein